MVVFKYGHLIKSIMSLLPFEQIKREVILKKKAETNPDLGCSPEQISTEELLNNGVINLNKPEGPTSHQVADYVKKILKIDKVGHGGTLDPAVTGVLPITLGDATKVSTALLKSGKEYICLMKLHKDIDEEILKNTIKQFVGKIAQLPPVKSSVKRQLREREIYYFELLEINKRNVLFKVGCEAGTYIRKLVHDLGQALKTGANMHQLIRTKAGSFADKDWVTMQDLEEAYWYWKNENNEKFLRHCIQPVESAVKHLAKIWVFDTTVDPLCHGSPLKIPGISKFETNIQKGDLVAVFSLKNELVYTGIAEMSSEEMQEQEKGICVKPERVFMKTGIYVTKK